MTNRITKPLEEIAGKTVKLLAKDAGKAVKDLYHDTGKRLKQDADAHLENDKKIATDLKNIGRRDDPTPVYHIDDDGKITRLHHDPNAENPEDVYRKEDLTQDDIDRLGLNPDSVGGPKSDERHPWLKDDEEGKTTPRPKKDSKPVDPGTTDLSRATQLARHADRSYGSRKKGVFGSNNYAAARVTNANGKGDFIMVGRSHRSDRRIPRLQAHSERMVGTPFLRQGQQHRIQELYTEREPCSTSANCSAWMAERLPGTKVSHSVEYGVTPESKAAGNAAMEHYLDALKASR